MAMEATILEALNELAGVLIGGGTTILVACLLGRLALGAVRPLRGTLTVAEGWLLAFALGSALLSTLVFGLCALKLVYDASFWAVGLTVGAAWTRWGRWTWPSRPGALLPGGTAWRLLLVVPAAVYGTLYAVHTLAPETRFDAMGYHLGLVQRYYRHHGFIPITTNMYAQLSQGAEMLYLFAYSLGRESAAKIVHGAFLVGMVGALLALGARQDSRRAGVFAAVMLFTCPVVIPDATAAYNDCALAFMLLAVFHCTAVWHRQRHTAWLAIIGPLIGFSGAIKATGFVAGAVAVAVVGLLLRDRDYVGARRAAAVIALTAAAVGGPWLAKNAWFTGNPAAPFLNAWFPNPYYTVAWEAEYTQAMRSYQAEPQDRLEQLLAAPIDLARGERYGGSVGWVFLLAPAALAGWRSRFVLALLAAAAISGLPWLANAGTRFLLPSLPFLALAMGRALERLPPRPCLAVGAVVLAVQCVTSWPAQRARWYYEHLWSVEGFPWRAALRLEPAKWHLARNVKFFLLADRLDKLPDASTRILSFCDLPEAYFQAELLVYFQGLENQELAEAVLAPLKPGERPDRALRLRWPAERLEGLRITPALRKGMRAWTVSELRLLQDGIALEPTPSWRFEAEPLPWHAHRLSDGDIFSRWSSREPPREGMGIEVLFRGSVAVDGVELVHPQTASRSHQGLVVHGLSSAGDWRALRLSETALRAIEIPHGAMRQAAAAMLRRHGIEYVVFDLDPQDHFYPQTRVVASDPRSWGLRRVYVDRTAELYQVLPGATRVRTVAGR